MSDFLRSVKGTIFAVLKPIKELRSRPVRIQWICVDCDNHATLCNAYILLASFI